jgi:hypothetical protein
MGDWQSCCSLTQSAFAARSIRKIETLARNQKEDYWKRIPSARLLIPGDQITNLNVRYDAVANPGILSRYVKRLMFDKLGEKYTIRVTTTKPSGGAAPSAKSTGESKPGSGSGASAKSAGVD